MDTPADEIVVELMKEDGSLTELEQDHCFVCDFKDLCGHAPGWTCKGF